MSFAMDGEIQDKVRELADKKQISISSLIRETLEKYLFADEGTTKLVLSLSKDVTSNPEKLQAWLNQKSAAIMKHFAP